MKTSKQFNSIKKQEQIFPNSTLSLIDQSIPEIEYTMQSARKQAMHVLFQNKKKLQQLQATPYIKNAKNQKKEKKFEIEDVYSKNKNRGIHLDEQKQEEIQQKLIQSDIIVLDNELKHNNFDTNCFYYTKNNELMSVKEFMYRLEKLNTSKQFEGKLDEIMKKKQKINNVQDELQQRSIRAAQFQCFEGIQKKIKEKNIQITDEQLMEMIKKIKFYTEKNLRMTSREADRQLVSFILSGDQETKRKQNKIQKIIDRAYIKISNKEFFNMFYEKQIKGPNRFSRSVFQQNKNQNYPIKNMSQTFYNKNQSQNIFQQNKSTNWQQSTYNHQNNFQKNNTNNNNNFQNYQFQQQQYQYKNLDQLADFMQNEQYTQSFIVDKSFDEQESIQMKTDNNTQQTLQSQQQQEENSKLQNINKSNIFINNNSSILQQNQGKNNQRPLTSQIQKSKRPASSKKYKIYKDLVQKPHFPEKKYKKVEYL